MKKIRSKMIAQLHFNRDFTGTNLYPAQGFEPATF